MQKANLKGIRQEGGITGNHSCSGSKCHSQGGNRKCEEMHVYLPKMVEKVELSKCGHKTMKSGSMDGERRTSYLYAKELASFAASYKEKKRITRRRMKNY